MAAASQALMSQLPLTTVFTPPASCSPTSLVFYEGDLAIYPDSNQVAGAARTECFPSGFQTASPFSAGPSSCPAGYSVACSTTSGEVTSAVCCPSGWPCTSVPWSSLAASGWPCGGPSAGHFAYTGWYQENIDSPVFTTTSFAVDTVWSIGVGVFIDWQSIDSVITTTSGPVTTTTHGTASSATAKSSAQLTSASTTSSSFPSIHSTKSSDLTTGAKVGVGIGIALFAIICTGLVLLFVQHRKRSRTRTVKPTHGDIAETHLPPELASRTDRPELEGSATLELHAGNEKQQSQQVRIAELEAELSRLRKHAQIAELS